MISCKILYESFYFSLQLSFIQPMIFLTITQLLLHHQLHQTFLISGIDCCWICYWMLWVLVLPTCFCPPYNAVQTLNLANIILALDLRISTRIIITSKLGISISAISVMTVISSAPSGVDIPGFQNINHYLENYIRSHYQSSISHGVIKY